MLKNFRHKIRNIFIAGLLVIIPISITFFLLSFLFSKLDRLFSPIIKAIFGFNIPGLGFLLTILTVFFVGLITTNIAGKRLIEFGENILAKIPLVRSIYLAAKQFLEAVVIPERNTLRQVVMLEFPRIGLYSIGFITCDAEEKVQELINKERHISVFVPTTPNPTTGFYLLVPKEKVIPLNMTVEDGIKLIVSGGIVFPKNQSG